MSDVEALTEEQVQFVIQCMSKWIDIAGSAPTSADVSHSSLLHRLLRGKLALPKAPPRRFSYPDYDLAEGKPVEVIEFTDDPFRENKGQVGIDQSLEWKWHDKSNMILKHTPTGDLYSINNDKILQKIKDAK